VYFPSIEIGDVNKLDMVRSRERIFNRLVACMLSACRKRDNGLFFHDNNPVAHPRISLLLP